MVTDISENIGDTQDVTRETVKIEESRIPFSEFIKVVKKKPLKPDNTVDRNSIFPIISPIPRLVM